MAKEDKVVGSADEMAKTSWERVNDKVHVWPYLTRLEFMCAIIITIFLIVWSIVIDAPLEEPANPSVTPNPSKAPWYFLGLQELLVYFDPWIAGVVLPTLIIVGLMAIPFIDVNPKGNGYYTFHERRFAIFTFLFGFLVLWVWMVVQGTFLRGPGWNFFMPWEYWDPHKVVALTNVDLPYMLGFRSYWGQAACGTALVLLWYATIPAYYIWRRERMKNVGLVRYLIKASLNMTMMGVVAKMALRIGLNVKYVLVTPWFNI
ncbi:MAG: cytochrome C [Nitrospinae bacterium]|nr:cytochrome C [Nitrospinota bacterium]